MNLADLQAHVRELSHAVIDGSLPGLFVVGPGGLGKSHAVLEAFAQAEVNHRTLNTHATAFGLYCELHERRDDPVVLLEDLEQLYTSLPALSILRSLLWGPKRPDGSMRRVVTWTTAAAEQAGLPSAFEFRAGIIMTANRFPTRNDVFDALRTRVPVVYFSVAEPQVFVFMREITRDGYTVFDGKRNRAVHIPAEECELVICVLEEHGATDLRILHHALVLYQRYRDDERRWRALLSTILFSPGDRSMSQDGRASQRSPDLDIVHELSSRTDLSTTEKIRSYGKLTGKSRASFFRHQKQLREMSPSPRPGNTPPSRTDTDLYEGLSRLDLSREDTVWTGQLPRNLHLTAEEFETLWNRHPRHFHEVRTPTGSLVPTPRWQQAYGNDYAYTGSKNNALPMEALADGLPKLSDVIGWCQATIDERLNGVLVNWYDGRQGHYIGKHRDSRVGLVDSAPIVTISFGESRKFVSFR